MSSGLAAVDVTKPVEALRSAADNIRLFIAGQMCRPVKRGVVPVAETAFGKDRGPVGSPDDLGRTEYLQHVIDETRERAGVPPSVQLVPEA